MDTLKFKTNIKCDGCIAKVKPQLDEAGIGNWDVDLENPDRILSVESDTHKESKVKEAVEKAGYKIESVN